MTKTRRYNGWTNYETWCVDLWLSNLPMTRRTNDHALDRGADELKRFVEERAPDFAFFSLQAALDKINWREIIENHQDDDS